MCTKAMRISRKQPLITGSVCDYVKEGCGHPHCQNSFAEFFAPLLTISASFIKVEKT